MNLRKGRKMSEYGGKLVFGIYSIIIVLLSSFTEGLLTDEVTFCSGGVIELTANQAVRLIKQQYPPVPDYSCTCRLSPDGNVNIEITSEDNAFCDSDCSEELLMQHCDRQCGDEYNSCFATPCNDIRELFNEVVDGAATLGHYVNVIYTNTGLDDGLFNLTVVFGGTGTIICPYDEIYDFTTVTTTPVTQTTTTYVTYETTSQLPSTQTQEIIETSSFDATSSRTSSPEVSTRELFESTIQLDTTQQIETSTHNEVTVTHTEYRTSTVPTESTSTDGLLTDEIRFCSGGMIELRANQAVQLLKEQYPPVADYSCICQLSPSGNVPIQITSLDNTFCDSDCSEQLQIEECGGESCDEDYNSCLIMSCSDTDTLFSALVDGESRQRVNVIYTNTGLDDEMFYLTAVFGGNGTIFCPYEEIYDSPSVTNTPTNDSNKDDRRHR